MKTNRFRIFANACFIVCIFLPLFACFFPGCGGGSGGAGTTSAGISSSISAAATWKWVNPQPDGINWNSIFFLNNDVGIIVGDKGQIARTTNGAQTWIAIDSGTLNNLNSIDCPNALTCFAVGDVDTILKSIDGGLSWSIIDFSIYGDPSVIECPTSDGMNCMIASSMGRTYATSDGGSNWIQTSDYMWYPIHSLECPVDTTTCYALGGIEGSSSRIIVKTTNGGNLWEGVYSTSVSSPYSISHIQCPADELICLARIENLFVITIDGGNSWTEKKWTDRGSDNIQWDYYYFRAFQCSVDASTCYLVGGSIVKTTDQWSTAIETKKDISRPLSDIHCPVDEMTCYAAGESGQIYKTIDAGETWTTSSIGIFEDFISVDCLSSKICYAASFEALYKSIDAGSSWTKYGMQIDYVNEIECISGTDFCYLLGRYRSDKFIYKIDVRSNQWTTRTPDFGWDYPLDIECPEDDRTCFLISGYGHAFKTEDGGETWQELFTGSSKSFYSLSCSSNENCLIGAHSTVLRTMDGGQTWALSSYNLTLIDIECFSGSSICYAVNGAVFVTEDQGRTWEDKSIIVEVSLVDYTYHDGISIECLDEKTCIVATSSSSNQETGRVFQTRDGGDSWTYQMTSQSRFNKGSLSCLWNGSACYLAGANGMIMKLSD